MSKMRIFISHTKSDTDFAMRLKEGLGNAGGNVWLDDTDWGLGQLSDTIVGQITQRPVFILVVSDDALKSTSVREEIKLARNRESVESQRVVLPVLASDTDLSKMDAWLAGFWRVEAARGKAHPPERAIQETIAALQREILNSYYPKEPVDVGQAFATRYRELGGEAESSLGALLLVDRDAAEPDMSPQKTKGYRLWCVAGGGTAAIYWSQRGGAQPVWGEIRKIYGGRGSRHGFPLTPELPAGTSPQGTNGVLQRFEGRFNYAADITGPMRYGATIYFSERYGARTTSGGIGQYFEGLGGTTSRLGFPVSASAAATKSNRGTEGWCQEFEGGTVHWSEPTGSKTVSGQIRDYYNGVGGSGSWLGFPASEEGPAVESPYGTAGTFQRFESAWDYPGDVIDLLAGVRCGATIYYSEPYGVQPTGRGIGTIYERMHGTAGVLGFPKSPELRLPGSPPESASRMQHFEGGTMYYRYHEQRHLIVPVLNAVHEIYEKLRGVSGELGFPLAPAEPLPSGEPGQCIQRFEGGIIAVEQI